MNGNNNHLRHTRDEEEEGDGVGGGCRGRWVHGCGFYY